MDLKSFFKALPGEPEQQAFAVAAGTSVGHIRNVMYGQKPCGPALAVAIERVSGKKVTRQELRPDDWQNLWPELLYQSTSPGELDDAKA